MGCSAEGLPRRLPKSPFSPKPQMMEKQKASAVKEKRFSKPWFYLFRLPDRKLLCRRIAGDDVHGYELPERREDAEATSGVLRQRTLRGQSDRRSAAETHRQGAVDAVFL